MSIINKIDSPADLKQLSTSELSRLSKEIRRIIIKTVSTTGGHLASSLGVVELAIAIHYVFNTPFDKIIWDVGHQSYAHKLLTGRRKLFHTLRQHNGLSGFTRTAESPFDTVSTGHSGTSISAGLGIACAKRLKKDNSKVIAVIGDGSMTSGLAYEGLNQAGGIHKNLIVILNDNDMSISRNVGALSSLLSRTFSAKKIQALRKELGEFLKSLPKFGEDIYRIAKRSEESFKSFATPGILFEAFNFDYFGPIDGHNLNHLIKILNNIKNLDEPVLLHVTTKKGKGYIPAEKKPEYFHGVSGFEVESGESLVRRQKKPTFTEIFGDTLVKFAEKDEKIVAVTAAMPEGTGLGKFKQLFPDRFFDVGIAEQHGVTFAAGLAIEGFKPVVAIYSTFLQRAYDQIIHDVCLDSLHVVFAIDRGGIVGADGPTHHGAFDFSYLRSLPNMMIMAPADGEELGRMLITALYHDGPVALRYPRGAVPSASVKVSRIPLSVGKGKILKKGRDLLILAVGRTVNDALYAHSILSDQGIESTVVNCRFVKPVDEELICSLAEDIPRIITIEENVIQGGFGSGVLECLNKNRISGFYLKSLGMPDVFVEHGSQKLLRAKYNIDADAIVKAAKEILG